MASENFPQLVHPGSNASAGWKIDRQGRIERTGTASLGLPPEAPPAFRTKQQDRSGNRKRSFIRSKAETSANVRSHPNLGINILDSLAVTRYHRPRKREL